jgi:uncharacterized protein (DUF58 family)
VRERPARSMPAMQREAQEDAASALSPELFQKIKEIQIRTQRMVDDVFAGEYETAFKGRGMEFEEVRDYQPGDDIRHIDWNVTARMGSPFVKVHREERQLTVMLLVDVSSSGDFGSGAKLKKEIAAEVAALLAYTAIRSNDRVGLIVFSDSVEHYIPPKKGRAHVWRVIRDILTYRARRNRTDVAAALDYLSRVSPKRVVAFVISDFLDEGYAERLRAVSRRHDVTAVTITDRRELELPRVGIVELEDAESGELALVDTADRRFAEDYARRIEESRATRSELFRSAGVGEVELRADDAHYIDELLRYFHRRDVRR